jgi:non-ribosomal peptide synthetase component E (peptide arylation enzyme)
MINRGGEKISAEEIENLVYLFPEVSQVATVAIPDPVLGERVCLYVVTRAGASLMLEQVRRSMSELGVAATSSPSISC